MDIMDRWLFAGCLIYSPRMSTYVDWICRPNLGHNLLAYPILGMVDP